MIRTSGEERISNFLLWQCAYAEFYFTPTLFPISPSSALMKPCPNTPTATAVWAGIRRSDPLKMPSLGEGGRGSARGRMRGEPAAAARQRVAPGNFALISHFR